MVSGFWVEFLSLYVGVGSTGLEKIVYSGGLDGQFFLLDGVREILHVVP